MHRRLAALLALVLALAAGLAAPPSSAASTQLPDRIELPPGFQPEGIAVGRGTTFYVGSIPTGTVYAGDLRTGEGDVLVHGGPGRAAIGLEEAGGIRTWPVARPARRSSMAPPPAPTSLC